MIDKSKRLKIGILGTRGIPNRYGGFEQCAEYLALGLVGKGHNVWVYNAHNHEYKDREWRGVHIIHCNDPEHKIGTAGQFIYDLNCLLDARKRDFDVLLQLGYTSNSVWFPLWPKKCRNVVNMDGLEWKRSKYSNKVQKFLKHAERWAAKHGDMLIADSVGIQEYLKQTYNKESVYIPYGAEVPVQYDERVLTAYQLQAGKYHLLIARMEPENNIEMAIKGVLAARDSRPLIIVGKTNNNYGAQLVAKYGTEQKVRFLGGIYDQAMINNLRYFSHLYFHGHSVGGTNPSLLEAMACSALIAANDNVFNRTILGNDAFYFSDETGVAAMVDSVSDKKSHTEMVLNNLAKISNRYNWSQIVDEYEAALYSALASK